MKPFIYIASLRRTGSTVLSEALTLLPYSFIFLEPKFGEEKFSIKKRDAEMFLKHGIDLEAFKNNWSGNKQKYIIEAFKRELMPHLASYVSQVGVKEIHHDGWRKYIQYFPEMKILLTGRDPRDIYISLFYRVKSGKGNFSGTFCPGAVADDLNKEFQKQLEMHKETDCLKIRYEDLCTNENLFDKILTFVESEIPAIGDIGSFNALNPKRQDEYELHGDQITDKRVNRWHHESDKNLVMEAQKTFDLMPEYCEFWGY
ncbi:MAG: hypothetical protein A3G70_02015 [Planctomycetes bacterium RIFCSPLOWO2_12_FULL_39_13]|nr:MAG: hypothetical protein A2Y09_06865 [Planctomycetes bacterium GWA2_39_15]OHC00479.1 MAG: hypothetical protein A3G70_02015 [Planctomycetes bacterium RIFCSPLOWO2_12_FULL_39_13]